MRLNKYEKNMLRAQKRKAALEGKGLYVFRNNTSGDLFLPRPTKSGITKVGPSEEFQGDDYYMFLVRTNALRLVRCIQTAEQQDQQERQELIKESTEYTMSDKLITEQPPVVTNEGTIEFVQQPNQKQKPLNENRPQPANNNPEVLLVENPLDGVEII